MPSSEQDERRPLYQYVFYSLAGVTGAAALCSFAVLSVRPMETTGPIEGIGLAASIIAVVATAATLVYGRAERNDRNADKRAMEQEQRDQAIKDGQVELDGKLTQLVDRLDSAEEASARGLAFGEQVVGMLREITALLDRLVTRDIADEEVRDQVSRLHKHVQRLTEDVDRHGRTLRRRGGRPRQPRPEEVDRFLNDLDCGDNVVPMPDPRKVRRPGEDLPGVQ